MCPSVDVLDYLQKISMFPCGPKGVRWRGERGRRVQGRGVQGGGVQWGRGAMEEGCIGGGCKEGGVTIQNCLKCFFITSKFQTATRNEVLDSY